MQPFAKLFHADDVGQVLVTIDEHIVMIRFIPPNMGLSALRADLPDTDEGVQRAEHLFHRIDEQFALDSVRSLLNTPNFQDLLDKPKGKFDA